MGERSNPRKALREMREERDRAIEARRWNALTPEEQQAELDQKEADRLQYAEEKRIEEEKQAKLVVKYMKVANTITLEDVFKSEGPMRARVIAFCTIRGYTPDQINKTLREAGKLFKATRRQNYGYTREGAVSLLELHIKHMFNLKR